MSLDTITEQLLPVKYEPKHSSQWLFESEGLSSFLVRKLSFPKITIEEGQLKPLSKLEVFLHDAIAPSGAQEILQVGLKASAEGSTMASLKLLDGMGTVVSMWEMSLKFDHADFGVFDYGCPDVLLIKAVFEVLSIRLLW